MHIDTPSTVEEPTRYDLPISQDNYHSVDCKAAEFIYSDASRD